MLISQGMASYSHAWTVKNPELSRFAVGNVSSLAYQEKTNELPEGGVTSGGAGKDVCGVDSPAISSWLYRELISTGRLNSNGTGAGTVGPWTRAWDDCSQTPFLFNNATRELINYDDPESYSVKAAFVRQHGMAGINMFDLTGDTSDSKLIMAARTQLIGTFDDAGKSSNFDPPAAIAGNSTATAPPADEPSSTRRRAQPLLLFSSMRAILFRR